MIQGWVDMSTLKLGTQLKLAFAIVLFVPLFASTVFFVRYYSNKIQEEALQKISSDLKIASLIYQNKVQEVQKLARFYSNKRSLRTYIRLGLDRRLAKELKKAIPNGGLYYVTSTDTKHHIFSQSYQSTQINRPIASRKYVEAALAGNTISGTEMLTLEELAREGIVIQDNSIKNGKHVMSITASAPAYSLDEKEIIGAFLVRQILNNDQSIMEEIHHLLDSEKAHIRIALFDHQRNLITSSLHTDNNFLGIDVLSALAQQAVIENGQHYEEVKIEESGRLAKYQPIFGIDKQPIGALMVQTSIEGLLNTQYIAITTICFIAVLGFGFVFLFGFLLSQRITRGLEQLTKGSTLIAGGDYSYQLDISSNDEIGQVAQSFNQMQVNLKKSFDQIDEQNKALAQANSRLVSLLVSTKELATSRVKKSCIEEVSKAILGQISGKQSFAVQFAYWEEEGNEQRYVTFQGEINLNGKDTFVQFDRVDVVDSLLETSQLIRQNDESPLSSLKHCSFHNKKLCAPIWYRNQLLSYIEVEGVREKDIKIEFLEFVDTLSQSLGITLENLSFTHNLEFKVAQQTEHIKKVLEELEQQHEQLKMTQSQLVQSEKMASLGTLVAGVAHEINNPSNFTQAGAQNMERHLKRLEEFIQELVEDDKKDEIERVFAPKFQPLYNNLRAVLEGSQRISAIVKNLRTFSRVEDTEQKHVDIVENIQSTLNLIEPSYREFIQFVCSFEERISLACWPSQLNQVFMNVIVNGCQSIVTKQKQQNDRTLGTITIRTFIEDHAFGISFQDTGIGIPENIRNKIFDPFFTTKKTGEGTGLGLSISYRIIEKHKGSIHIESVEGAGCTFTIMLPIKKEIVSPIRIANQLSTANQK